MKASLLILLSFVGLVSCSEKDNDDKEAPVITITAPANNQVVVPGVLQIKGTVTDNAYIGQIHVEIYEGTDPEPVHHIHIHPGTKSFTLNEPWTVQSGFNYKIKVIADDPAANTASKQVEISCN